LRSSKIVERRQQQKDGKNSQSQFPSHRPDFICFPQCALKPTPLAHGHGRYDILLLLPKIGIPTVAVLQIWSHLLSRCTHALSGRCERFEPAHNLPAKLSMDSRLRLYRDLDAWGFSLCMSEVVAFDVERSRSDVERSRSDVERSRSLGFPYAAATVALAILRRMLNSRTRL
jgi:hypothetical protein